MTEESHQTTTDGRGPDHDNNGMSAETHALINAELQRARTSFPKPDNTVWALMEEVGELAQAIMEQTRQGRETVSDLDILKEALQVATMAIRIAEEGDRSARYRPDYAFMSAKLDENPDLWKDVEFVTDEEVLPPTISELRIGDA